MSRSLLVGVLVLAACGSSNEDVPYGATSAASEEASAFYVVRSDEAGGAWARLANRESLRCADNEMRSECPVAVDWSKSGLSYGDLAAQVKGRGLIVLASWSVGEREHGQRLSAER